MFKNDTYYLLSSFSEMYKKKINRELVLSCRSSITNPLHFAYFRCMSPPFIPYVVFFLNTANEILGSEKMESTR